MPNPRKEEYFNAVSKFFFIPPVKYEVKIIMILVWYYLFDDLMMKAKQEIYKSRLSINLTSLINAAARATSGVLPSQVSINSRVEASAIST